VSDQETMTQRASRLRGLVQLGGITAEQAIDELVAGPWALTRFGAEGLLKGRRSNREPEHEDPFLRDPGARWAR
jgi:hypothetical protein